MLPGMILLAGATLLFQSCNPNAENTAAETKQPYIIPDSLLKTLTIDSVREGELINAITLTARNLVQILALSIGASFSMTHDDGIATF